jgi:hypothetical protein
MFFSDVYPVPANTTANNPSWRKLKVAKGNITSWVIYGPDEKADLLHIKVLYHGAKIMPFGGVEFMYPFDSSHPINENIEIKESPYELDIYAFNEDDSYPHEYILGVVIEPDKPVTPGETIPADWWSKIKGVFGVD